MPAEVKVEMFLCKEALVTATAEEMLAVRFH